MSNGHIHLLNNDEFSHIYESSKLMTFLRNLFAPDWVADSLREHIYYVINDPHRLREMANYRGKDLDLPVNIWLDENKTYKYSGHWKRIKFQKDRSIKVHKSNLASIDLNAKFIKNTMSGCDLSSKELKQIQNFVINNKEALELMSDGIITALDLYKICIKGGELASDQERQIFLNDLNSIVNLD